MSTHDIHVETIETLRQLVLDMWTCIWAGGLGETAEGKRLRRAMIEALNLDE